jgi:hypothetical protein
MSEFNPGRIKKVIFSTSSRPALRCTLPPIQWLLLALSPGVKRSVREADHSSPRKCSSIRPLPHTPSKYLIRLAQGQRYLFYHKFLQNIKSHCVKIHNCSSSLHTVIMVVLCLSHSRLIECLTVRHSSPATGNQNLAEELLFHTVPDTESKQLLLLM